MQLVSVRNRFRRRASRHCRSLVFRLGIHCEEFDRDRASCDRNLIDRLLSTSGARRGQAKP